MRKKRSTTTGRMLGKGNAARWWDGFGRALCVIVELDAWCVGVD